MQNTKYKAIMVCSVQPGAEREADHIKQQIQEAHLQDRLIFLENKSNVKPYYMQADFFLSTSKFEGFPMTWGEALLHGLPIVAYDLPYLEYCRLPDSGICTVAQNDISAAVKKITEILSNDQLYDNLSKQARKTGEYFADFDFRSAWKNVFEDLQNKRERFTSLDGYIQEDYKLLFRTLNAGLSEGGVKLQWERDYLRLSNNSSNEVQQSLSFRIGRAITWGPRMVRNAFRCLHENGFVYTLKRIPVKLENLYRKFYR